MQQNIDSGSLQSTYRGCDNILADAISRNKMDLFFSQAPGSMSKVPVELPKEVVQLALPNLEEAVQQYYSESLAPSTKKVYSSGQKRSAPSMMYCILGEERAKP